MAVIQGNNGVVPRHSWNDLLFTSGASIVLSVSWFPAASRCAAPRPRVRLQTEGGIRSPPTCKDAITTTRMRDRNGRLRGSLACATVDHPRPRARSSPCVSSSNNELAKRGDASRKLILGKVISLRPTGLKGQGRCNLAPSHRVRRPKPPTFSLLCRSLLSYLGNRQVCITQRSSTVRPLSTAVIPHGEGVIQAGFGAG